MTDYNAFTDKYFLRSKQILEAEGLNPFVRAQVFIRKGPGQAYGINEAVDMLAQRPIAEHGGAVYALPEGARYDQKDTLMVIEAPIQDIIDLETVYLGVITAETTKANDGNGVDLNQVTDRAAKVVQAAGGRPVSYFGARHWRFDQDPAIAAAAYEGGMMTCSTDAGAAPFGKKGIGTIPHTLENIYASKDGYENAVKEATCAFDRNIDPEVPRIALIDYANREIDDVLATAKALDGRLAGYRIDTCGENIAQGALATADRQAMRQLFGRDVKVPQGDQRFWVGTGVTVTGTYAVRQAVDQAGYTNLQQVLSSGFADPAKVEAFVRAEEVLETRLFDMLGAGGLYPARTATMDIVAVGADRQHLRPMAKVGRGYRPNKALEQRI